MPRRRAVLAAVPALLTTGCVQLLCPHGTRVTAGPFRPEEDAVVEFEGERRELASTAIEAGTATATVDGAAPIPDGAVVAREDAYYHLELTDTSVTAVPALSLDVDWESGRRPPDGATVLAAGDLPASDRDAVERAVYGHDYDETGHPDDRLRLRGTAVPYPDGLGDSRLADAEEVWVTMDDRAYRITVNEETTTRQYTYEYAASEVATDVAGLREWVADERAVDLDDLSGAPRAVVEQAVEDSYLECGEPSDRLAAVQERVTGGTGQDAVGEWYVSFGGERYTLRFVPFST